MLGCGELDASRMRGRRASSWAKIKHKDGEDPDPWLQHRHVDERDAESAEELFAIRKQKAKELQHRIALREERLKVKAIRSAQAKRKAVASLRDATAYAEKESLRLAEEIYLEEAAERKRMDTWAVFGDPMKQPSIFVARRAFPNTVEENRRSARQGNVQDYYDGGELLQPAHPPERKKGAAMLQMGKDCIHIPLVTLLRRVFPYPVRKGDVLQWVRRRKDDGMWLVRRYLVNEHTGLLTAPDDERSIGPWTGPDGEPNLGWVPPEYKTNSLYGAEPQLQEDFYIGLQKRRLRASRRAAWMCDLVAYFHEELLREPCV